MRLKVCCIPKEVNPHISREESMPQGRSLIYTAKLVKSHLKTQPVAALQDGDVFVVIFGPCNLRNEHKPRGAKSEYP